MKNPIKAIFTDEENNFFILKSLIRELGVIIGLAFILWLLKDDGFIMCCRKSACLMSFAFIFNLGVEVFSALDNNRWRIKLANEEYQVYKASFLILLNVLVFLLTAPSEQAYLFFLGPLTAWGILLLYNHIHRWFKS